MTKKKILLITNTLNAGGAEKVLSDLLINEKFLSLYEVDLLMYKKEGKFLSKIDPSKVFLYSIYDDKDKYLGWFLKKIYKFFGTKFFLKSLVNKVIKKEYDCIISFLEGMPVLLHSFLLKKAKNNITWVHNDFVTNHWTKDLFYGEDESNIYKLMDQIVAVSNSSLASFNKIFPNSVSKKVIYNFVNLESKNNFLFEKEQFSICSIGRLETIKNYQCLIKALNIVKNSNYNFVCNILGEGSEFDNLNKLVKFYDLQNHIFFKGFCQDPILILSNSDILISSSFSESFSLVIAEALFEGVPVIASRTIGACELLEEGRYGLLFDIDDENDLAAKIILLIDNNYILNNFKILSQEKRNQFNIDTFLENFEKSI